MRKQKNIPPIRRKNSEVRSREYLTPIEVQRLLSGAQQASTAFGRRNAILLLMLYRHGLRVSEGINLKWEQVFFESSTIHIRRLKNGIDSTHYLAADELSELKWLRGLYPKSKFLFCSRLLGPLAPRTVQEIVAKAGATAGFEFPVHPHMLRHSKGHQLANRGTDTRAIQEYLGHKNINHTVRYTSLSPDRFKDFGWADLP